MVVHPQSTVHAMIEYTDGSVLAQISATDMRMPIQYALTYPERCAGAGAEDRLGGGAQMGIPAAGFRQVSAAQTGLRSARKPAARPPVP